MKPNLSEYLYGRRAVVECLRAGRRASRRLMVAGGIEESGIVAAAVALARERGVPVEIARRDRLDSHTRGANHQGVVLEAGPYPYVEVADMLSLAAQRGEPPLLLLLDLLQDVQNVGTLLRTAEAVGAHGAILQERRAAEITPAVVNASAGAVEHLHVAQVTNLVQTMKSLKEADVWLAGLDLGADAQQIDQANWHGGLGLVVGSEGKGLRRLVRETCDFIVYLPMRGRIESLNAATAGSVALYQVWAARGFASRGGTEGQ